MKSLSLGVVPFVVLAIGPPSAPIGEESVSVVQAARGCFHHEEQHHKWTLQGDLFTWGDRKLTRDDMASLRRAIVEARHEVPDLLAEAGITPESLAAHRDEIIATVMPDASRAKATDGKAAEFPPELERLLAWDRVAPLIREKLLGIGWSSTEKRLFGATFVTDGHEVVVESRSFMPWMLPWKVTVDEESFMSEDLAVPRALLKLLDPKGPCAYLVDGSSYWSERIWTEVSFWDGILRQEVDQSLSKLEYTELAGWSRASTRMTVRQAKTGSIDLQPLSMYFELESKVPAAVDTVCWHDFLIDGKPAQTWDDFLALYERADACVGMQRWLLEWKRLGPKREVELQAAGTKGFVETWFDEIEELVLPAWEHAGFSGRPEFELRMREDQETIATIYLSSQQSGALIHSAHHLRAKRKAAHHWFDDLAFSYDPRGLPPTYGRVDSDDQFELRTMPRVTSRRR